eukprot:scaffold787_cov285-Chaetoceros_neogracile.AAC.69
MSSIQRDYPIHIPYQIDFSTTTVGRHIRQTKRHVTWRFGFAHVPSLLANKTGVACRGIEIDIHLIWSVASRKHVLYMNNVLVHHSVSSSSSIAVVPSQRFEHSVLVPEEIVPGGHVVHIQAWALGFGHHAASDKQFILTFDGQDYTRFCPIYLLGSPQMMHTYASAIKKAQEKLSHLAANPDNNSSTASASAFLGNRQRRDIHGSFQQTENNQQTKSNTRYWEQPTVPLPHKSSTGIHNRSNGNYTTTNNNNGRHNGNRERGYLNSSAPSMYPDIPVAQSDREEEDFLAQARLRSFRDLKNQNSRDFRGDDMTIPSFARPPVPKSRMPPHASYHREQKPHLQVVKESKDLLDIDDGAEEYLQRPAGLVRSSSNVTLDTAIKTPEDDLISLASGFSGIYSHLDPNQNWKTQQDASFRMQRPPVYADNAAGELIQPSPSFSNQSMNGNVPIPQSVNYAGRHMGYAPSVNNYSMQNQWQQQQQQQNSTPNHGQNLSFPYKPSSFTPAAFAKPNMGFTAAPPPTFESLNAAYAPSPGVAGGYSTNHSYQQQYATHRR